MNYRMLGAALLAAFAVGAARAEDSPPSPYVVVEIEARVLSVTDAQQRLGNRIQPGDLITGLYIYNPLAVDEAPSPIMGSYQHNTLPYGFALAVNGFGFHTDPADTQFKLFLQNNFSSGDRYIGDSLSNIFSVAAPGGGNRIQWVLVDPSKLALSDDKLTATPPRLADWASSQLFLNSGTDPDTGYRITATIYKAEICTDRVCKL